MALSLKLWVELIILASSTPNGNANIDARYGISAARVCVAYLVSRTPDRLQMIRNHRCPQQIAKPPIDLGNDPKK